MRHMRRPRLPANRNRIDLDDPNQIRSLKKRLGISQDDLHRLVARVGNSISAVSKEIELAKPVASVAPAAEIEPRAAVPAPAPA